MIKMKNKRTKQMVSLALCLAMSQTCLPVTVSAGELSSGVESENAAGIIKEGFFQVPMNNAAVSETDLPDNDELFAAYAEQYIFGTRAMAMYGANRGDSLTSVEQEIYSALKNEILKVAQNGGRTEIQLDVKNKGITLTIYKGENNEITSSQFNVNFSKIYWMLIEDCPYELYWHNQNGNWNTGESGFSYAATDDISNVEAGTPVNVENMSFKFYVYTEYQKESNSYEVSDETLETAKKAKANADAVIEQAKNLKSDYQKLLYCFNYIKEAADYHESGYNDRISLQMTWVFDEKPDTKVMSEGYAKAFKYLCDGLGVECYVVSGGLDWGGKSYEHTWNIVVLNGNSYLVDVANCDANDGTVHSVGYPDKLFLKAPVSGTGVWNDPYIFIQADNVGYYYHDFSYAVFGGSKILTLADTDYTEPEIYKVKLSEEEFVYNGEEQKPTVTVIEGETVLEDTHYTITYSNDMKKAGQKTITIIGKGEYGDIDITKTVTIKEKPLTVTGVTATNRTYDGTDKVAIESVTLEGIEGADKVSVDCTQLEGTVSGVNAETYTSVTLPELTLTGDDAENYTLQPVKEFATTVTIEQAEVPNVTPLTTMIVSNACTKVCDVTLPDGWAWKEDAKNTELKAGEKVEAIAEYTGKDKENYKNLTVTIAITRSTCDHEESDVICDSTVVETDKKPTCMDKGLGHTICTKDGCGEIISTEIEIVELGHSYTSKITKPATTKETGIKTYTCTKEGCGHSYEEVIPKKSSSSSSSSSSTPTTQAPSTEEPSTEEPSTEEPSTGEPSTEEPSTEEPSTGEPSTENPGTGETTTVEWKSDEKGVYYEKEDGTRADGWLKLNDEWYFFDKDGYRETDWVKDNGTWYYLDENGAMETGWLKDEGKWYYLDKSGAMQTDWVKDGNTWYYLNTDGAMQTGWLKDGDSWYYLNTNGSMKTGWLKDGETWYYLNTNGSMKTGWIQLGAEWFYLNDNGSMAADTYIGEWYVDKNGYYIPSKDKKK